MKILIIASWLSSFFYSVLLCFDWLIDLRKIILMGSRYPRSNLSNKLRCTTLGFHSWEKGEQNASKRATEESDLESHTHNTHPTHKPIAVYNEDEEESRNSISCGNRILQMWMWFPCTRVSSEVHTLIILYFDLTNLENCTFLLSPLVYKFLESFNTLSLYLLNLQNYLMK